MKERPILFSGPMVRAILEGRKTQTRRVVKGAPTNPESYLLGCHKGTWGIHEDVEKDGGVHRLKCPYGVPGDRLWVRESFRVSPSRHVPDDHGTLTYSADGDSIEFDGSEIDMKRLILGKGYPSIHMPRWASRISLEITGFRVERLNDISENDAFCEGTGYRDIDGTSHHAGGHPSYSTGAFKSLWESINGPGSWDLNPWVWVVEFKRLEEQK